MSGTNAIDPLPLGDFPLESDTQDPGFEQLFSDLVGDAGTPADGFEDDVDIANALLDSLDASLDSLSGQTGGTLDDTFADILSVDPEPARMDAVNFAAALPDMQTNVDNLGNLVAGAALPAPPAPTGGGTAAGGCLVLDAGDVPEYTGGRFTSFPIPVTLQNNTQQTVTIKGETWSPNYPTILAQTPSIVGKQIAPGGSLTFDIVVTAAGDGPIQSTLTVQTDSPDPQPCIIVKLNIIVGSPGGPGPGPGGPQPTAQRISIRKV